ncbi:hypothetical protein QRN89_32080 [Streptomyces chengbuensis]|uniref:hypothetical protein n=1 Tax=Streptomyces TaxID=1883 RepID=UPI0025B5F98E|nr:hypothetical protein [Streptomyces sp. HUAS CB01]WJY54034.1 hypothetical protein QRN89_32080 [Streptomyces sp. HUAS CB01]
MENRQLRLRPFLVRMPSGDRYWTVLDEDELTPVVEVDEFLRHVRFGRDHDRDVRGRDEVVLDLV